MNSKDFRAKTVKELIDTEKAYIGQLSTVLKFFAEPCASEGLLNSADHNNVFGELPTLLQLNQELLRELSASLKSSVSGQETSKCGQADDQKSNPSTGNVEVQQCPEDEETQPVSTCPIYSDVAQSDLLPYLKVDVGSAFRKIAPFFKTYSSYASKYEQALNIIEERERSCSKLRAFMRSTETRPEVQCRLVSLLIAPIQRLPRYKLLLAEILRHTPPGHPFRQPLENSLALVAAAATRVDQCVGEGHQLLQLTVLQRALCKNKPRIIAPGRALIRSGLLYKANRSDSGSVSRLFFLFTDILMYTKVPSKPPLAAKLSSDDPYSTANVVSFRPESLVCCCVLPLRHCTVIPILADDDCTPVFRVVCQNEDLTLYSKSGKGVGQAWIRALKDAISAAAANRRTLKKDSSAKRPLRRAQLKRGDALAETDTSLQQLKASSPVTRLASPSLSVQASPSLENPSPQSSICSSGTSFRTVSPSPRSLFNWFGHNKNSASSSDVSCNPSPFDGVEQLPPVASPSSNAKKPNADQQFSSGSCHSLDAISSKFSLTLKKKRSVRAENSCGRPERTPTSSSTGTRKIGLLNFFPRGSSASKTSEENTQDETKGTSAGSASRSGADMVKSPVKIRALDASPYRPVTRQSGPYRSRWDSGEIGVTSRSALEEENKTVSLSKVVKPKIINPAPLRENLNCRPIRPIPFPGKYPRSINGHAALRPVYDSDKPRVNVSDRNLDPDVLEDSCSNCPKNTSGKRRISPSNSPPFKKASVGETPLSSDPKSNTGVSSCVKPNLKLLLGGSAAEKRTLRRRSKSCSPNRSLFRSSSRSLRSSVHEISPHQLAGTPLHNEDVIAQPPRLVALRSPTSTIDFLPTSSVHDGARHTVSSRRPSPLVASIGKPADNFEESWRREKLWGKRVALSDVLHIAK